MIQYPLSTEKSIRQMESENKLIFVVDLDAEKPDIKDEAEDLFDCTIQNVNTMIDSTGKKRAYIQFGDDTPAIDIATELGLM